MTVEIDRAPGLPSPFAAKSRHGGDGSPQTPPNARSGSPRDRGGSPTTIGSRGGSPTTASSRGGSPRNTRMPSKGSSGDSGVLPPAMRFSAAAANALQGKNGGNKESTRLVLVPTSTADSSHSSSRRPSHAEPLLLPMTARERRESTTSTATAAPKTPLRRRGSKEAARSYTMSETLSESRRVSTHSDFEAALAPQLPGRRHSHVCRRSMEIEDVARTKLLVSSALKSLRSSSDSFEADVDPDTRSESSSETSSRGTPMSRGVTDDVAPAPASPASARTFLPAVTAPPRVLPPLASTVSSDLSSFGQRQPRMAEEVSDLGDGDNIVNYGSEAMAARDNIVNYASEAEPMAAKVSSAAPLTSFESVLHMAWKNDQKERFAGLSQRTRAFKSVAPEGSQVASSAEASTAEGDALEMTASSGGLVDDVVAEILQQEAHERVGHDVKKSVVELDEEFSKVLHTWTDTSNYDMQEEWSERLLSQKKMKRKTYAELIAWERSADALDEWARENAELAAQEATLQAELEARAKQRPRGVTGSFVEGSSAMSAAVQRVRAKIQAIASINMLSGDAACDAAMLQEMEYRQCMAEVRRGQRWET